MSGFQEYRRRIVTAGLRLSAILALLCLGGPRAEAQGNPYLNNYLDITGGQDNGTDDSTVGDVQLARPAQLVLTPGSAGFTQETQAAGFVLGNSGTRPTTQITMTRTGNFRTSITQLTTLAGGTQYNFTVSPPVGVSSNVTGVLTFTAAEGGTVTATLTYTPPPPASPPRLQITPGTITWSGAPGTMDWQEFTITNIGGAVTPSNMQAGVSSGSWNYFQFTESGRNWPNLQPGQTHIIRVKPMDNLRVGYRYSGQIGAQIPGQAWVYGSFSATVLDPTVRACSNLPAGSCIHDLGFFPGFIGFKPGTPGDCSQSAYFATSTADRWNCSHPSSNNYNPAIPTGICASNAWTPIGGYATSECPQAIINGGVHQCPRYYRCN
jgi:hypothetical protein